MRVLFLLFAVATARAIQLRPRVAPRPAPARLGALAPAALDGARTRVAALRMAEAESEGQEEDVEVIPLLAAGVAALGAVALVATATGEASVGDAAFVGAKVFGGLALAYVLGTFAYFLYMRLLNLCLHHRG